MSTRTRRAIATAIGLVAALSLVACSAGTPSSPTASPNTSPTDDASVVLDDALRAELGELLATGFASSGMPGVAAYVRIGDDEWESSLGVGDLETEEPFDPAAKVRIASNTKTFVATAILQLVDAGEIALDDPLERYVPGITNGEAITIRDLLQMSSGIWELTGDRELIDRWTADPVMAWTVDDSIALIQGKPEQFAPGEKVVYTDSNYILLTKILEDVSGMTAAEAVDSMIIQPLGLADTRFPAAGQTGVPDPHQQGYRPPGETLGDLSTLIPISEINPEFASGAGNMTSTIADLVTYVDALADGDLLSPELQAERVASRRFEGQTVDFGYGLGIIRIGDVLGHDGAIMGYSSVMMRYPEADATFVLVGNASTNSTTPTMDIFLTMLNRIYPDQIR